MLYNLPFTSLKLNCFPKFRLIYSEYLVWWDIVHTNSLLVKETSGRRTPKPYRLKKSLSATSTSHSHLHPVSSNTKMAPSRIRHTTVWKSLNTTDWLCHPSILANRTAGIFQCIKAALLNQTELSCQVWR